MIPRRRLGHTDMDVSVLGWGGAEVGYQGATGATVERLLSSALDAGLNVIDTAECYGESEALIGTALARRRGDVFLFTKCGHAAGLPGADWHPPTLERSIDRSLERLRTDRVDLVQLHSCDEATLRQGDVVDVLRRARERGKTRYIGYSGDSSAALAAVRSGAFDTLQISVSIADQEGIDRVLPEALARGMGVIAKRPIANAAWRTGRKPESEYHHAYWDRLQALAYPFLGADLDTSVATALRFTLATPGVHTAIVGTANPDRWPANAALAGLGPLPPAEYAAIRERWRAVARPDWVGQV